jgi:hypothetical protein
MSDNTPAGEQFTHEERQGPELDEMVRNSTHPEMQNIDPNQEFTAVNFGKLNKNLTELLYARIDRLKKIENENNPKDHQGLGTST